MFMGKTFKTLWGTVLLFVWVRLQSLLGYTHPHLRTSLETSTYVRNSGSLSCCGCSAFHVFCVILRKFNALSQYVER